MSPILKGVVASQISGHLASPNSYESIQTITVGAGGASSISFTSIPSTYSHLQIRSLARKTATGGIENLDRMRLNSDSGANYSDHFMYGYSGGVATNGDINNTYMIMTTSANNTSGQDNVFAGAVCDILDYKNTNKYKTLKCLTGLDINSSGAVILTSGSWRNTSAITTISITPNAGDFMQYSSFALYGIKG